MKLATTKNTLRHTAAIGAILIAALQMSCDAGPGDRCSEDSACGEGLVCARPVVDGGPAAVGVCSIAPKESGGSCAFTDECAKGLFCSNDVPSDVRQRYGKCIPQQAAQAPCYRNDNCAAGLTCSKADGASTGVCMARTPASSPDAAAAEAGATAGDGGHDAATDGGHDAAADGGDDASGDATDGASAAPDAGGGAIDAEASSG